MCTDHDLDLFVFVPVDHDLDLPVSMQIMIQTCLCVYRSRFGPVLSVCMLSSQILLLLVIFTGDSWRLGVCCNKKKNFLLYMCRIPKHSYLGHIFICFQISLSDHLNLDPAYPVSSPGLGGRPTAAALPAPPPQPCLTSESAVGWVVFKTGRGSFPPPPTPPTQTLICVGNLEAF